MENLSKWAFYENNRDFNGIKVDLSKRLIKTMILVEIELEVMSKLKYNPDQ